jgi:ATP-dependent protease ClpP protease subunit
MDLHKPKRDDEYEEEVEGGATATAGFTNMYSHFAKRLADRNWFSFWGDVTDESCELCSMFLMDAMLRGDKEVNLLICSGGGSEDDTRALLGIMEMCKAQGMVIKVYGAGCIASAAFDIFSACSRGYRFAFEVTMFMTHSSSGHVEDDDMYELQKKFDMWTLKQYTGIHAATRKRFMKTGNWWFDPNQAVEYGIADHVVKAGEALPDGPIHPQRKTAEQQKREAAHAAVGEED